MKSTIITAALIASFSTAAFSQTWNLDKAHSQLNFGITHLGISEIDGSFGSVTAKIVSSKDDLSDAVVDLSAEVSSINTGNDQRNNHLKSPDFFDASKYPTLSFKSTNFKKTGAKTYEVTGDLSLHGVTKTVVLNATLNGTTTNPMNKKTVAGFKVTGTIKRSDFGIATGFPAGALSDEVALNANTEFIKE
jgi:polyisoprenoid-binding protein YceI